MSGRPKKENEKESGLGLTGGLLLAGGAAAVGFLASQLWSDFKSQQAVATTSARPTPTTVARPAASNSANQFSAPPDSKTRARMEGRKKTQNSDKDEVPKGAKCVVCFENPKEIIIEPCNHVCICEDCAEKINNFCPICRERILAKKPVYLAF